MPHAIRFHRTGGPEVLRWEEVAVPAPQPDEATVRHHAVGLNFIDIYHRTGLYPLPLPSGLGLEGAGVVEAVGSAVTDLAPGDRVDLLTTFEEANARVYASAEVMEGYYLDGEVC